MQSCKIMWKRISLKSCCLIFSQDKTVYFADTSLQPGRMCVSKFLHTQQFGFTTCKSFASSMNGFFRKFHTPLCSMPWSDEQSQRPELGSHQYRTLWWKHIQKALWCFLTLQPSSCPRADEEVEDSHGNRDTECRYRAVFMGGGGWKYLPFIATSKHTDERYSHKNRGRRH